MAKGNKKEPQNNKPIKPLTPEEEAERNKIAYRMIGLFAGLFSKAFLEKGGCEVDFKINGEPIEYIEKLCEFDISERLKLALEQERYEDAAKFKKMIDHFRSNPKDDGKKRL